MTQSSHADTNSYPTEWLTTVSGRLYTRLKKQGTKKRKRTHVEGVGDIVELFHFGGEKARLIKHLAKGEGGATLLIALAEWHEYQHLPWWKEAIDAEGTPVEFLDVPVALAARDAKVELWQQYFRPSMTIEHYHLAPTDESEGNAEARQKAEEWVRSCIQHVLAPKLKPHFAVEYSDFLLRLIPESEEAMKSRFTDQSSYRWALEQIAGVVPELEQAYLQKQSNDIMRLRM